MPDPAQLASAGPWAVVVAIGLGLGIAFMREAIVQGSVYRREVKRGDDATAALKDVTKALNDLTEEVRWDARDRHAVGRLSRPPDASP